MNTRWVAIPGTLALLAGSACEAAETTSWIYASRLDLTCSDPVACYVTEGKEIQWFHVKDDLLSLPRAEEPDTKEDANSHGFRPARFSLPLVKFDSSKNDRALIKDGGRIMIAYVYPPTSGKCEASVAELGYEEVYRSTAAVAALSAIASAASENKLNALDISNPVVCIDYQPRILKKERGLVKMTFIVKTTGKDTIQSTHTLITGTKEHLFFTGDVILKKVSQVKFDKDKGTITEKAKPDLIYLGANYQWGDVYASPPAWHPDRIVGKVMVSIAKKPLDSVGVGLGYQFQDLLYPTGGTGGAAIQVYAGHYWTKGDAGPRKKEWRLGLSFNLETLIGWVKPAPAKS
jgi:hypothetical protein